MKKLVHFENNYVNDYRNNPDEDDRAFDITIDGYPEDENEEGEVVSVLI